MKKNAILEKIALPVTAAASMAALLLPGYYMQANWGTLGLVASEVLLLIVAVLSVVIFNGSLKGAFPFNKISLRSVFGSLLTFAGGYILMISATIVVYYFFPEDFVKVQESLAHVIDSDSMLVSMAVVALTPAICEESLFRGALRYFSGWMKNIYLRSLVIGILFGIFHMNPIRFVPTAILGVVLTFIALKTDNMIYPMLLHFTNNALSVLSSFVSGTEAASEMAYIPKTAVASYITICAAAPLLIHAGSRLMDPKGEGYLKYVKGGADEKTRGIRKRRAVAFICALAFFITGTTLMYSEMTSRRPALKTAFTRSVNCDTSYDSLSFSINEDNVYIFSCSISNYRGLIEMQVLDEKGEVIEREIFKDINAQWQYYLTKGDYSIKLIYHIADLWDFCRENDLGYTREGDLIELHMDGDLSEYTEVSVDIKIQ